MVKSGIQSLLSSAVVARAWTPLVRQRASVFTLHRFATPQWNGGGAHDLALLREILQRLHREGYHLLDLEDLARALRDDTPIPPRAACFTVDDGYADFAEAAEVFLEYDCPVTVFLTTGFLDRTCWMWWDQIAYVFERTSRAALDLQIAGAPVRLSLSSRPERERSAVEVAERCKRIPDSDKWSLIRSLSLLADVDLPTKPPAEYAPLTWDEVRQLERRGIRFGPHSVTHPILPMVCDAQSVREISESCRVVSQHLEKASPVFSYPNGDFGDREIAAVSSAGMLAAVSTVPVYAAAEDCRIDTAGFYRVPRFPYPDNADQLCLTVSGFSRVSLRVRSELQKIGWLQRAS